ncbi:MAG: DUF882 domain-containing protein [Desulfobacteraceae bacterium]|nr:MAG: DUF882 domain-containing protein [Desulfobacteraceae bacterium]
MPDHQRRDFLKVALGALAATALPLDTMAATLKGFDARRTLSFYNTHTNEQLKVCYFDQGNYNPEGLTQIDHILRDHRTDTIKQIDPELLDLLFAVKCRVRPRSPFHVISGYRSPATNEMLRRHTSGVAKTSFHTRGQAIDIRLPGYNTAGLRNLCVKLRAGGVGYYSQSDFVHLDVGPVRNW